MNRVYKQKIEVADRLKELGLSEELLRQAATSGLVAWLNCSENHPPSFPGIVAWGEMVRSIREGLLPSGWLRVNDRNLPLTVNPDTRVALTASSGDDCTGIESKSPRTRNPKGSTTKELAESNAVQLGLFSDMGTTTGDGIFELKELIAEVKKWDTWLLLAYRDRIASVVRYELSRPVNIGDDGRVDGWHERIILGEIPFDSDDVLIKRNGNDGGRNSDGSIELDNQSDVVDVPVKRRA